MGKQLDGNFSWAHGATRFVHVLSLLVSNDDLLGIRSSGIGLGGVAVGLAAVVTEVGRRAAEAML